MGRRRQHHSGSALSRCCRCDIAIPVIEFLLGDEVDVGSEYERGLMRLPGRVRLALDAAPHRRLPGRAPQAPLRNSGAQVVVALGHVAEHGVLRRYATEWAAPSSPRVLTARGFRGALELRPGPPPTPTTTARSARGRPLAIGGGRKGRRAGGTSSPSRTPPRARSMQCTPTASDVHGWRQKEQLADAICGGRGSAALLPTWSSARQHLSGRDPG